MLSQSAEYVLRVVVSLAAEEGRPATTHRIAAATQVPEGYLSKLLQAMGRAGLVHSQRGLHGGFVLTRPPEQLTIYDVIRAVDPPKRITSCPLNLAAHSGQLCSLHRRLDEALAVVEQAFKETTIGDVVRESGTRPLCATPGEACKQSRRARG